MGDQEKRNMERVEHWVWTWNNDVMRMVDECYAEDCEVTDMFRKRTFHGREELRAIEEQMIGLDATRSMQINRMVASGDTVAVEVDASFGDVVVQNCVFLTFDQDGFITTDHSYGNDPSGLAENDPR